MELNVNNNVSFHILILLRGMARQQTIAITVDMPTKIVSYSHI